MAKRRDGTGVQKDQGRVRRFLALLPVIVTAGFLPLVTTAVPYEVGLEEFPWYWGGSGKPDIDLFLIGKARVMTVLGLVMAAILLTSLVKKKTRRVPRVFLCLGVYLVFVLISGILATDRVYAFFGSIGRFEPVPVIVSYGLACLYTFQVVREKEDVWKVLVFSSVGVVAVLLIGLFQGFGLDFFRSGIGQALALGRYQGEIEMGVPDGRTQAYSTLYNPNYFSNYVCLIAPVCFCTSMAATRRWAKISFFSIGVLSLVVLYLAGADSGMYALAGAACLFIFLLMSRKKRTFVPALAVMAVFVVCGVLLAPRIVDRLCLKDLYFERRIARVDTGDADVTFTTMDGEEIRVSYEMADGGFVSHVSNEEAFRALGGRVEESPSVDGRSGMEVYLDGQSWNFTNVIDGTYYFINRAFQAVKIDNGIPKAEVFPDTFITHRGLIWNYSLPLLKDRIVVGSGADNFVLAFPQEWYLPRNYIEDERENGYTFDVKPHSFYLQQWIEHGLIGFAGLMAFIGIYLVRSVRICRRADLKDPMTWIALGCLTAVAAELIAWIANDSFIVASPVFWVVIGIGIAVDRIVASRGAA